MCVYMYVYCTRVYCMSCTCSSSCYLLAVGQDLAGVVEAALSALGVWLPLPTLRVHVQDLPSAEHGDLGLGH